MHVPTATIHTGSDAELRKIDIALSRPLAPLSQSQTRTLGPMAPRKRKNWMRNQACPCKSGRKFKKCCWGKYA